MLPGTGHVLPCIRASYCHMNALFASQRDIPHNFIINLTVIQPPPLTTSLNPAAITEWIYQMCGSLRGKGVSEFVKTGIWEKKRGPTHCSYTGKEHSYYIFYMTVFQALSKQVSFQPALYTSPNTLFLCIRIHLGLALSVLCPKWSLQLCSPVHYLLPLPL